MACFRAAHPIEHHNSPVALRLEVGNADQPGLQIRSALRCGVLADLAVPTCGNALDYGAGDRRAKPSPAKSHPHRCADLSPCEKTRRMLRREIERRHSRRIRRRQQHSSRSPVLRITLEAFFGRDQSDLDTVPKPPIPRAWPTAVDLFCGCGGVTAALKERHFRVVAAVDNNALACESYRRNHRRVRLYERDIELVDPSEIRNQCLGGANLDLLVVCSPCQPFSPQNRKSGEDDRSRLILSALRFAEALEPKLIFFENVPGLTRSRFASILTELTSGLQHLGYVVGVPEELDAADYGVPQRRLRCVLLAQRGSPPPPLPAPVTPPGSRITVRTAIEGLPALKSGEKCDGDTLHFARNHREIALKRLALIPRDGGSRDALPEELRLECHREHDGHPDVYGRMRWDDVAPTLTTGCTDVTRGRYGHPRDDRAISLREAARLQTFPDRYRFAGSAKDIATQVGNAVPVRLIEALVPTLRSSLQRSDLRNATTAPTTANS